MHRACLVFLMLALASGCGDDAPPPVTDGGADATPADTGPRECTFEPGTPDVVPAAAIHTPRWALSPWISKDISDRDDTFAFLQGFIDRDIPVGAVVLDSPWETQYNTFEPHPERYPDFADMVETLHAMDVRIVLWTTQMVNNSSYDLETGGHVYDGPSPNYRQGSDCGYFVDDGQLYGWWKGQGAAVDFFDPDAVTWWHRQQDRVLDLGIDGWKLDFGESYLRRATVSTAAGVIPHQEYSEAYYRDFLDYGVFKNGREFVTMVRPYDQSYDFEGRFFARPEHAPVGWVGDNHRDWVGINDALDHMFRSADAGYVVVGSDIGGYLDRDELSLTTVIPFILEVFQRWTALGAMTPFMQLHGRANLAPWTVEGTTEEVDATVALYRYWSKLHTQLIPFFYSLAERAYAGGDNLMRPVGDGPTQWAGDYRYFLGEAFLVAPVVAPGDARDIELPAGNRYYDWWDPAGDAIDGGTTLTGYDLSEPGRIGVFVVEGAIVPMDVTDDSTALGSAASAGHRTILVYPGAAESTFTLHDEDDMSTTITTVTGSLTMSRATLPVLARIRLDAAPVAVAVDGSALAEEADLDAASEGYVYDSATKTLVVKLPASTDARTVTF